LLLLCVVNFLSKKYSVITFRIWLVFNVRLKSPFPHLLGLVMLTKGSHSDFTFTEDIILVGIDGRSFMLFLMLIIGVRNVVSKALVFKSQEFITIEK